MNVFVFLERRKGIWEVVSHRAGIATLAYGELAMAKKAALTGVMLGWQ
jgi:hypothetical protein